MLAVGALPSIEKIPDFSYSEFKACVLDDEANHREIADAVKENNLRLIA